MKKTVGFIVLFFMVSVTNGQIALVADGPGDTYELITGIFSPAASEGALETPDCGHAAFERHITEVFDSVLGKFVFVFHIHVVPDNDRCIKFDRQRNEIKTTASGQSALTGIINDSVVYKWKFKIDSLFQPSDKFTHIHQIKGVGGNEIDMPLITLTPRAGNPEKLQLMYSSSTSQSEVYAVSLAPFKGTWVEVTQSILYRESGKYEIFIRRASDDSLLFHYKNNNIRMWRTNASWMRPKWGIYRSLLNSDMLRDEEVRFADFSIWETTVPVTVTPSGLSGDTAHSPDILLFPNPVESEMVLAMHGITDKYYVRIISSTGSVLFDKLFSQEITSIDVSLLKAGIYILSITELSGTAKEVRFIKL
ncbi:MAG: T9SS type A sorting domain-containing protein [Bacteroidales bacterium]|nr:T9SS type A sorting domain-containing protein [Bacteroidales bacterium]